MDTSNDPSPGKGECNHERILFLLDLVQTAIDTNGGFKVFIPQEVRTDPSCLKADDVIDRLRATQWKIEFRNGREVAVCFTDLIVLLYNLKQIKPQIEKNERRARRTGNYAAKYLDTDFDEELILRPEVVRELLGVE